MEADRKTKLPEERSEARLNELLYEALLELAGKKEMMQTNFFKIYDLRRGSDSRWSFLRVKALD